MSLFDGPFGHSQAIGYRINCIYRTTVYFVEGVAIQTEKEDIAK